jgi:hypothetical protein
VQYWDQLVSRALSKITGKPLDWRGFQHGKVDSVTLSLQLFC